MIRMNESLSLITYLSRMMLIVVVYFKPISSFIPWTSGVAREDLGFSSFKCSDRGLINWIILQYRIKELLKQKSRAFSLSRPSLPYIGRYTGRLLGQLCVAEDVGFHAIDKTVSCVSCGSYWIILYRLIYAMQYQLSYFAFSINALHYVYSWTIVAIYWICMDMNCSRTNTLL